MAADEYTVQDFDSLSLDALPAPPGTPIVETVSPSSVDSDFTGGDNKTVGVFFIEDPTRVCCASIGTSDTRFCTCLAEDCTKSSHKVGRKLSVEANSVYIISKKNVASNAVHMKLSELPDKNDIPELKGRKATPGVWSAFFLSCQEGMVQESPDHSDTSWVKPEVSDGSPGLILSTTKRLKRRFTFGGNSEQKPKPARTPGFALGIEPRVTQDSRTEPFENFEEFAAKIGPAPEDATPVTKAVRTIISEWPKVGFNFSTITESIADIKRDQGVTNIELLAGTDQMIDDLGNLKDHLEIVRGELGPASLLGSGSIREHVLELTNELAALKRELALEKEGIRKQGKGLRTLNQSLVNLGQSHTVLYASVNKHITTITARITALEGNPSRASSSSTVLDGLYGGSLHEMREELETLRIRLQALEVPLQLGAMTGPSQSSGPDADQAGVQVEALMRRVGELEQVTSGETIEISGVRFNSVADVSEWLRINEVNTGALAWDLFSVLVAAKPKSRTGQERADEAYSAIRTKTSVSENDLIASMSHVRPLLLYGKKNELAPLEEGFAACKSFDTWNGNLHAYKHQLSGYVRDFCSGIKTNLRNATPSAKMVGFTLLSMVENQWTVLCQYIDGLTLELTAEAKFSKDKAWKLVAHCLSAVFEQMYEYRARVALLEDISTLQGRASLMWAVLQCHRIMEEVLNHKFRSHPSVVRVMSLFLLTERVDPKELVAIADRVKLAEAKASDLERAVRQIEVNKRDIGNLKNDLDELKRRGGGGGAGGGGAGRGGGGRGGNP
jgi:hypothetical protein